MAIWRKYYAVEGLEVSKGGAVRRTYNDCRTWNGKSLFPAYLERQVDKDGNLYVEIKKPKKQNLRIDVLVAKCFLPRPGYEQNLLIHKDKDKTHCWADNLQWATPYEYAEFYKMDPSEIQEKGCTYDMPDQPENDGFRFLGNDLFVSENAEVKMNGEVLKVYDSFFDGDMDIEAAVGPFVHTHRKSGSGREYLEDLVTTAFLPKPRDMKWPGLLHKDLDYKNCALSNLEWVDRESDEFKRYLEKRKADIKKRTIELNPHRAEHLRQSSLF